MSRDLQSAGGGDILASGDLNHSVSQWLSQVRVGDEEALQHLWNRYYGNLVRMARSAVARCPGRVSDEDDVVQSALTSFYFRVQEGRYPDLHDRTGLWKLLLTMTLSKARAIARKEGRRREIIEEEYAGIYLRQGEPSPLLVAQLADQLDNLMNRLPDELHQRVAIEKLEGYTNQEIADRIGRSLPTVERKLQNIRKVWSSERQ